jgi:hypothetical protein
VLSNHPHVAAQLAAAHRDDLLRHAEARRLRRFARAATRAARADRADPPGRTEGRASGATSIGADSVAEELVDVSRPVIEAEPAPLPGSSR